MKKSFLGLLWLLASATQAKELSWSEYLRSPVDEDEYLPANPWRGLALFREGTLTVEKDAAKIDLEFRGFKETGAAQDLSRAQRKLSGILKTYGVSQIIRDRYYKIIDVAYLQEQVRIYSEMKVIADRRSRSLKNDFKSGASDFEKVLTGHIEEANVEHDLEKTQSLLSGIKKVEKAQDSVNLNLRFSNFLKSSDMERLLAKFVRQNRNDANLSLKKTSTESDMHRSILNLEREKSSEIWKGLEFKMNTKKEWGVGLKFALPFLDSSANERFAKVSGSLEDLYEIKEKEELERIRNYTLRPELEQVIAVTQELESLLEIRRKQSQKVSIELQWALLKGEMGLLQKTHQLYRTWIDYCFEQGLLANQDKNYLDSKLNL